MQVALLAQWLSQILLWSRACVYEHSGGKGGGGGGGGVLGQDHMSAIIADSLMSTSNEMCGGFLVHTTKHYSFNPCNSNTVNVLKLCTQVGYHDRSCSGTLIF